MVISIVCILMGIALPVLNGARRQVRTLLGMSNQKQIVAAVNLYAADYDGRYPPSVATIGVLGIHWHWQEPTRLTGVEALSPQSHRAMSEYLGSYIEDAGILFCPNAPRKYKYLKQAWQAGDQWDNPETAPAKDSVSGTYCFWWNYVGHLCERCEPFVGPRNGLGGCGQSQLVVSCYFGYDHWRSPGAFGSCEGFTGAMVTPETYVSAAYWSRPAALAPPKPKIKLSAGYVDGHVETYSSSETVPMRVSISPDGSIPYPDGVGPGVFYLPKQAL